MILLVYMIVRNFNKRTQMRALAATLAAAVIMAVIVTCLWSEPAPPWNIITAVRVWDERYYLSFREGGWVWSHARTLAECATVFWAVVEVPIGIGGITLWAETCRELVRARRA